MNNKILSIAAIGLLTTALISCDSTKKTETTTDSTEISAKGDTVTKVTTTTTTETVKTDVPKFSSEEVNKSLAEYAKIKDEYVAVLKSQNLDDLQAVNDKFTVWMNGTQALTSKLKHNELQKFSEYILKLNQEWANAATEAAGN